jgi:hypothetical protein
MNVEQLLELWYDWQENRSTRRKPFSVSICPPEIPHGMTWDRTQATKVEAGDKLPELLHGPEMDGKTRTPAKDFIFQNVFLNAHGNRVTWFMGRETIKSK